MTSSDYGQFTSETADDPQGADHPIKSKAAQLLKSFHVKRGVAIDLDSLRREPVAF